MMIKRAIGSVLSALGLIAVGLAFSATLAGPASAAGTGYTPAPTPPPTPAPSSVCGAGTIITSSDVGTSGGTVTGAVGGSSVAVNVPSGALPDGTQVAITDTSSTTITVPNGDTIVLDFGVNFCVNGAKFTGTFATPITVTVSDPAVKPGQTLFVQTPGGLVPVPSASIGTGSFTLTITGDPVFVLVAATNPTVIPGATTVVTGKPFLLEGIVAGGLLLLGSLLLLRLRFRHH
ncbi:MAG TPA: hypothetical protein VN793_02530 [Acidimicrobiales bacterium]|nr:hypothetical protein [Acidimicrobiales bacterium]